MKKTEFDKILKIVVDNSKTTISASDFSKMLFTVSLEGRSIVVLRNMDLNWLNLTKFVRENSILWTLNFTDEFIHKNLQELLVELKYDSKKLGQIGKITKNWLAKLKQTPLKEYVFVRPVHYLNTKKELNFGNVKFVKLSKRILDGIIPLSLRKNDPTYKDLVKTLIDSNGTKFFGIVKVSATDQSHAEKLSREYLERGINAIRIFYDSHPIVQGEDYVQVTNHSFIHVGKNDYGEQFSNLNQKIPVILDTQIKMEFEPFWKILRPFLFTSFPNDLQSRILVALEWYGDAMKDKTPHSSFFKYVTSIETLLVLDRVGKAEKIAKHLSKIMYDKTLHQSSSYDQMKLYYETRNGVIHAGRTVVHKEDLNQLHSWSMWLIQNFTRKSKKYQDIPSLLKKEHNL